MCGHRLGVGKMGRDAGGGRQARGAADDLRDALALDLNGRPVWVPASGSQALGEFVTDLDGL